MGNTLRFGIVGAGVFGGYHAEKCFRHKNVDYIGTFDPNPNRANETATPRGGSGFNDYHAFLDQVEAVIIASPAATHFKMTMQAIKAGKSVLVEKPLAVTASEANELANLSERYDVKVQVGHQERFVAKAIGLDRIKEKPVRIETQRLTPYSLRGRDTSVTLDLMIHDIDLVLWLMGAMPEAVEGHTLRVALNHIDASLAFLDFPATRARLTASRADDVGLRTMRLVYNSGEVLIDFNAKTLKNTTDYDLDVNFAANPLANDSLGAGLNSFVESILNDTPVAISASEGASAVKIAEKIDRLGR